MSEQWKDIPGFEGRYQVSDLGRVRSIDHRVRVVVHGVETTRLSPGKMLKPGRMGGREHVSVAIGKGNSMPVHYLVALAFIGPRPEGYDVAHGDGDASNNRVGNLRYATRASNNQDMVYHGRRRLTVEQIRRVRVEARSYYGAGKALALEFKVSPATISDVLAGRSYGHVE
jgi:hypothetical protein